MSRNGLAFEKYVTNDFNVSASVSIDTKLYKCKIRVYGI